MRKNINRSTGKKLESAGKNKKTIKPSLQLSVQMLKQKIERTGLTAAQRQEKQAAEIKPVVFYIGIDLGDKKNNYCVMDDGKEIRAEGVMATTAEEFKTCFSAIPRSRIALEVGTHSPWISALLEDLGHEVYVANPRKMESIKKSKRKNDKEDARKLARLVRSDPELLYPIRHRGLAAREDLILLRARDAVVGSRTKLINCVRGLVKSIGGRVPKCSSESFCDHARKALPESVQGKPTSTGGANRNVDGSNQEIRQGGRKESCRAIPRNRPASAGESAEERRRSAHITCLCSDAGKT